MSAWRNMVHASLREVYGYAGVLAGRDRAAAERLVRHAYQRLAHVPAEQAAGKAVVRSLRSVVRREWLTHLGRTAAGGRANQSGERRVLADLPDHVRAIVVLSVIDGMGAAQVAELTGVSTADVDRLFRRAQGWLTGVGEGADRLAASAWVREVIGDEARPRPAFVRELAEMEPPSWLPASLHDGETADVSPEGATAVHHEAPFVAVREPTPNGGAHGWADPGDAGHDSLPSTRLRARFEHLPRWVPVAAAMALLLVAIVAISVRGGDEAGSLTDGSNQGTTVSNPTTSVGAATGTESTTVEASTVAVTVTVTAAVTVLMDAGEVESSNAFTPACARRFDSAAMPSLNETKVNTFGPLTARPTLTISLPRLSGDSSEAASAVEVVPGGVNVSILPGDWQEGNDIMVVTIGVDGRVRSVRCYDPDTVDPGTIQRPSLGPLGAQDGLNFGWDGGNLLESTRFTYDGELGAAWSDLTLHNYLPDIAAGVVTLPEGEAVVVAGCTAVEPSPDAPGTQVCRADSWVLRLYREADGTMLREVAGVTGVLAASGRYALVRTAEADRLVDLTSGALVAGQQWASGTFRQGIDLNGETLYTRLDGGVVATCSDGLLTVWFPSSLGLASHRVALD